MERINLLQRHLVKASKDEDVFSHVELAPPDVILGLTTAFRADQDKNKVSLGVGAYRDNEGNPYVFKCVRKAEEIIQSQQLDKEYAPIDGTPGFVSVAQKLMFAGEDLQAKYGKYLASSQCIGGTGALRLAFEFLRQFVPGTVYLSNPTWVQYPYWDPNTKGLNINGMLQSLSQAAPGSIILLHACAHNPTGVDPTSQQWKQIAQVFKQRKLFPYFDCAYQGFASGDPVKDVEALRIFLEEGLQFIVTQSFAKNFGLYGERVGAVHVVCNSKESADRVSSQLKILVRVLYSNPPVHGARIIQTILSDQNLAQQWKEELKEVAGRIIKMREELRREIEALGVPGKWDHITSQIGMFSYTGLSVKQCEVLTNKYHIYLVKNGRISLSGLNSKNVKYVATAIKDAVENA